MCNEEALLSHDSHNLCFLKMYGMRREAGGGIRMGNTCKSMADSCQCMAKTSTIL